MLNRHCSLHSKTGPLSQLTDTVNADGMGVLAKNPKVLELISNVQMAARKKQFLSHTIDKNLALLDRERIKPPKTLRPCIGSTLRSTCYNPNAPQERSLCWHQNSLRRWLYRRRALDMGLCRTSGASIQGCNCYSSEP